MKTVQAQIEQYVQSGAPVPPEAGVAARNISEPGLLADMVAYSPDMSTEQRQELLETIDVVERLKLVSAFLNRQVEVLELKGKIQSEVKAEIDKTQREYILREQLKAIQRELGEDDPQQAEIHELREKVEQSGMPEDVRARALKEVDRMSRSRRPRPRSASSAPTSTGSSACPGTRPRRTTSTFARPPESWTRIITGSRRSRSASSSTSPSASWRRRSAARSSASWARPASARPRSGSRSPARWAASSSG